MKSTSLAKAFTLSTFICFALPVACGDDDDNKPGGPMSEAGSNAGGEANAAPSDGGAGGAAQLPAGISSMPVTVECSSSCSSAKVGLGMQFVYIDPCCAEADGACGLSTDFLQADGSHACEPRNQPGAADPSCANSESVEVPFGGQKVKLDPFVGCCRPSGMCGVLVNNITIGSGFVNIGDLSLGCVDAAPFFPGQEPVPCTGAEGGGGGGGAGGMSGMAGAPSAGSGGSP